AGGTATFSVVLTTQPTDDVTVTFSSSNLSEGTVTPSVTFTNANWNVAQTVTVTGVDDDLKDGNIAYTIVTGVQSADPLYAALKPADVQVINRDNDTPPPVSQAFVSAAYGPYGQVVEVVRPDGTLLQFDAFGVHVLGGGVRAASVAFGPRGQV